MSDAPLKTTPLTEAHRGAGARMVPFAGYEMPVQYAEGVLKEHLWTRAHCGLFDVSHMGPAFLRLNRRSGDRKADHAAVCALLEPLVCGDLRGLKRGQQRYTLLLGERGGIVDDLMVGRPAADGRQGELQIVVNAGTKEDDFARIASAAGDAAELVRADDRGLIAVQGPEAEAVTAPIFPEAATLSFMTLCSAAFEGAPVEISRSGYTGEDGFEILVPAAKARALWERLLGDPRCRPIGLGARDSLRLEAGLPLYGHDLDETISPVEASLEFALSKRRRESGDFPGAARALGELAGRLDRRRVGLRVLEGAPAREGAEIVDQSGAIVGAVTSGGFSPTLSAPIAMGYVPPALAEPGARLGVVVRGKRQAAEVVAMPFVPHRYRRKPAKEES
ncbi:MAG TPA: glycine cleavage system aminomethyltransferase GcvT [Caulobacteraceae bacterium]|nr:glycine cleavage system aminomethyltransferase GcvT [Caulobacteraceae bacterium]